jgi:hypothetical protein
MPPESTCPLRESQWAGGPIRAPMHGVGKGVLSALFPIRNEARDNLARGRIRSLGKTKELLQTCLSNEL